MARAFIGLGANLGDPAAQLGAALEAIGTVPGIRVARRSSFYRTAPIGYTAQPEFFNAIAEIDTSLPPRALLEELHAIERRFGRERRFPNAPRTLDLDLLLYDDREIHEAGLEVPHPRMHERAFVLAPLVEIAPDCIIPGRGVARDLLSACSGQSIERMSPP